MSSLRYPFKPLPKLGRDCILWTSHFYNPKNSDGNTDRLERLNAQVRIVMRIATNLKHGLWHQATNACMKTDAVKDRIQRNVQDLIKVYRAAPDSDGSDVNGEQEDDKFRIAQLFMRKRHLLHIILFIFANEPQIRARHKNSLRELTELVEEDTTEWMEIIDYLQTLKNPNYLNDN
jgi:hypothetical protein